jgi:ribosome-binding factor A
MSLFSERDVDFHVSHERLFATSKTRTFPLKRKTNTKNLRAAMLECCGEIRDDDGIDPREYLKTRRKKGDRKTKQLCQQVMRTLSLALTDCEHDLLQNLSLVQVVPAPDSSCLMLIVQFDGPNDEFDHGACLSALQSQTVRLQFEISRAIHRKRVPNLTFSLSGPTADSTEASHES